MLTLPPSVRIFLAAGATDMRKSFDGLAGLAKMVLDQDPLSGHLFVFRSRRGDRLKILWWDRDGYVLWYKRLEKGTFRIAAEPAHARSARIELDRRTLAMILEGIDPVDVKKTRRFSLRPLAPSARVQ